MGCYGGSQIGSLDAVVGHKFGHRMLWWVTTWVMGCRGGSQIGLWDAVVGCKMGHEMVKGSHSGSQRVSTMHTCLRS